MQVKHGWLRWHDSVLFALCCPYTHTHTLMPQLLMMQLMHLPTNDTHTPDRWFDVVTHKHKDKDCGLCVSLSVSFDWFEDQFSRSKHDDILLDWRHDDDDAISLASSYHQCPLAIIICLSPTFLFVLFLFFSFFSSSSYDVMSKMCVCLCVEYNKTKMMISHLLQRARWSSNCQHIACHCLSVLLILHLLIYLSK